MMSLFEKPKVAGTDTTPPDESMKFKPFQRYRGRDEMNLQARQRPPMMPGLDGSGGGGMAPRPMTPPQGGVSTGSATLSMPVVSRTTNQQRLEYPPPNPAPMPSGQGSILGSLSQGSRIPITPTPIPGGIGMTPPPPPSGIRVAGPGGILPPTPAVPAIPPRMNYSLIRNPYNPQGM